MLYNTLYNGKDATEENVLEMMQGVGLGEIHDDMTEKEKAVIRKVAAQDYEGAWDDLDYLVDELNSRCKYGWNHCQANLQTVYDILSKGDWHYMEKGIKEPEKSENSRAERRNIKKRSR